MKIGIDVRLWSETGVGRYIRNLVKELVLQDRANEYVLFARKEDIKNIHIQISPPKADQPRAENSPAERDHAEHDKFQIKVADFRWHSLKEQLKFPQILYNEKLDLVHFPYISVPVLYNKPFIVTIHDLIPFSFSTSNASTLPVPLYQSKLLAYKYIVKKAAQKAKKIITVSQFSKNEITKRLRVNPEKIIVTYEGIDEKIKNPKINKSNNLRSNYFLYVGNAFPHKNLDRFLEAFALLIKDTSYSFYNVIFVGREDYFYKKLKKRVKTLGIEDRVFFEHYVQDEELSNLYANAIAFVTPSLMEGFGLPGLEAMSRNCLVLASNISVHKEIYQDTALFFDPTDITDIKKKLEMVCTPTTYQNSIIVRAHERTRYFSWKKLAKETIEVYNASK